ncbi:unnamed protein product, partial [Closterium sp. NIES-54]
MPPHARTSAARRAVGTAGSARSMRYFPLVGPAVLGALYLLSLLARRGAKPAAVGASTQWLSIAYHPSGDGVLLLLAPPASSAAPLPAPFPMPERRQQRLQLPAVEVGGARVEGLVVDGTGRSATWHAGGEVEGGEGGCVHCMPQCVLTNAPVSCIPFQCLHHNRPLTALSPPSHRPLTITRISLCLSPSFHLDTNSRVEPMLVVGHWRVGPTGQNASAAPALPALAVRASRLSEQAVVVTWEVSTPLLFPDGVDFTLRVSSGGVGWGGVIADNASGWYGGGERFNAVNQKGNVLPMFSFDRFTDVPAQRSYKPVPFVMSSSGYGVWVQSYTNGSFSLGANDEPDVLFRLRANSNTSHSSSPQVHLSSPSHRLSLTPFPSPPSLRPIVPPPSPQAIRYREQQLRVVFIAGPSLLAVLSEFTRLSARPSMPPDWAFAPWKGRDVHFNCSQSVSCRRWWTPCVCSAALPTADACCALQALHPPPPLLPACQHLQVVEDAEKLRQQGIPGSVILIDSPWETSYNDFTINRLQFHDPDDMFLRLEELGFYNIFWATPFINRANRVDMPGITAGPAAIFDEADSKGFLVQQEGGGSQ